LLTFRIVRLTTGFGILLSTLSGLKGNSLVAAKIAIMFFSVKAFFLAGLNREVKCSLLIILTPLRFSCLACLQ
jgi:hypothetical protein